MNNALDIALTRIMFTIPKDVLTLAFQNKADPSEAEFTLEELILQKVIQARVYKDTNLYGGKLKKILLMPDWITNLKYTVADAHLQTGPYSIYRIPPFARENLPLVEVHSVTYRGSSSGFFPGGAVYDYGMTALDLGADVLDSHTMRTSIQRPCVTLLSGDLVKLHPSQQNLQIWLLSCRLAYDSEFTNINTSAMDTFADLCVAAVKSYVYNTLFVPVDRAYVEAGFEISSIKSIIDGYSDSEQRYREMLDQFAGGAQLDPDRVLELAPLIMPV